MAVEKKPKRRTRERILETGLRLFNEFGEPNVTTTVIADEMNISPGNLYYHFHNKDEIVEGLFVDFEREMDGLLQIPPNRHVDVEDAWLFLHLLFELIWKFRFIYRDLDDLLSRNRLVEMHFRRILDHQVRTALSVCDGMVASGMMRAEPAELHAAATNMVLVATYWLKFEFARHPRKPVEADTFGRGVYQVMSLLGPFLQGDARKLFERLSREYVPTQ